MIRAIAFDLDDTLIDTSHLLVPQAARAACEAMQKAGLTCTLDECLQWRSELAPNYSHREIFPLIATKAGAKDPTYVGEIGSQEFYNPPIPANIPLTEGALDLLDQLQAQYALFLVTSGVPETQTKKIIAAGLSQRFKSVHIVDKFAGQNKESAFRTILGQGYEPDELLSVGNRLREEIRYAKGLGAKTCYFEFGEHMGETPEGPDDYPDFRIRSWKEFRNTCQV